MPTKFVRTKDIHSSVCRNVAPTSQRKHNKFKVPASAKYFPATLRVPDEYALALLEMYPGKKSVGSAILHHIKLTIKPAKID